MKASTRNRMIGTYHELKGSFRAAIGNRMGKRQVAFSGHVERVGGKMRAKFGRLERIFGW